MLLNRVFRGITLLGIWAGMGVWGTVVGWGVMEVGMEVVGMEVDISRKISIDVDIGDDMVDADGGEGNIVLNVKLLRRGNMIIIIEEGDGMHRFILEVGSYARLRDTQYFGLTFCVVLSDILGSLFELPVLYGYNHAMLCLPPQIYVHPQTNPRYPLGSSFPNGLKIHFRRRTSYRTRRYRRCNTR
jgi:hypothetical protein